MDLMPNLGTQTATESRRFCGKLSIVGKAYKGVTDEA